MLICLIDQIKEMFYWILLAIDAVFYSSINTVYNVFIMLTKIKIMDGTEANQIIQRVYILIGVVMLFLLSYSLLKSIVNPDNKSIESSGKVIFNIIKAIVLVAFVPTLFDFAFDVQYAVLNQDTIGKLITGSATDSSTTNSVIKDGGINMAMDILQAFIIPNTKEFNQGEKLKNCTAADFTECDEYNVKYESTDGDERNFKQLWNDIENDKSIYKITSIAPELVKANSSLKHMFLLSTLAACCVLYLLVNYGISLGLRLIKLAFYELIAPLPILASILPQKKDMLNKWVSATLKTYAEVFIRIAILFLSVYLISLAGGKISSAVISAGASGAEAALARAIIIIGMVTFLKKAPELISEATGIKTDGMSLGIKDQLKQGGVFAAAGIAGGAATGFVKRGANAIKKGRKADKDLKAKGEKGRFRNGMRTAGSVLFGGLGDAIRGGRQGYNKDAGSFADARDAARKGGNYVADRISRSNNKAEKRAAGIHGIKKNAAALKTIANAVWKGRNGQAMPALEYDASTGQIVENPNKQITGSAAKLENVQRALAKVNMGGSALSGMITGAGQWAGIIGNADAAKKEANIADQLIKNSSAVTDICKDIVAKNQTALKLNANVVSKLDQNSLKILDQSGIDVRGMSLAAIESLTKQYEGAFDEKSIRESFKFDEDAFKKSYSESHQNASETEIAQAMSNAKQANEDRINKAVNETITERANIVAELQHISSQATKTITDDMPDRIFNQQDTEIDYDKFTFEREQVLNIMKDSNRIIEDNPNSVTIESIKSGVKDSRGQEISAGVNDQIKEGAAASAFKNIKKGAEALKSTFQNEINAANRLEANQKSNSSDK